MDPSDKGATAWTWFPSAGRGRARYAIDHPADDGRRRRLAAWELAVFRASFASSEVDFNETLSLLDIAEEGTTSKKSLRRIGILRAECLQRLGIMPRQSAVLSRLLQIDKHSDLYFGLANLQANPSQRLEWINRCFKLYNLPQLVLADLPHRSPYESIRTSPCESAGSNAEGPKVSIIIPAYNAAPSIDVALESLLCQTWTNTEILVVDDSSSDATRDVVTQYAKRDARVQLLCISKNSGPYIARNLALESATGEFITCHDADDWSHPWKIESQVRQLLAKERVVANMSLQARMFDDLRFYRRGKPGFYVHGNMSSLMFPRGLIGKIGFWDSVRFAGDFEYLQRIKHTFGETSVETLEGAPLSFQKQSAACLTASPYFGYDGFKMGARREYENAHRRFFSKSTATPFVDFPLPARPFALPEPMRPQREVLLGGSRRFDVVLASDFRFPGGTTGSNVEEIKAQLRMGLRTGLVQLSCYYLDVFRPLHPAISELIDTGMVDLLVYGENIDCDLLVVRQPWVLQDRQIYIPHVNAKNIRVIVNQPPMKSYRKGAQRLYSIGDCVANLKHYFGGAGIWHPIGPRARSLDRTSPRGIKLYQLGR